MLLFFFHGKCVACIVGNSMLPFSFHKNFIFSKKHVYDHLAKLAN